MLPYFLFGPRLDLRNDRETVASWCRGEERTVSSLLYFEVTFLGDRHRLRFCPVGLLRGLDYLWFARLFRNHVCSHFIVLLGLSFRTQVCVSTFFFVFLELTNGRGLSVRPVWRYLEELLEVAKAMCVAKRGKAPSRAGLTPIQTIDGYGHACNTDGMRLRVLVLALSHQAVHFHGGTAYELSERKQTATVV